MSKLHRVFLILVVFAGGLPLIHAQEATEEAPPPLSLLAEPFLQLPGANSVHVVWFTEFRGQRHTVTYGASLDQQVEAQSTKLSRVAEDAQSFVGEQKTRNEAGEEIQIYTQVTPRDIWRHAAVVTDLTERVPYFVTSIADDGTEVLSGEYTLAPLPAPGQPLRILLTSDHQLKPMTLGCVDISP